MKAAVYYETGAPDVLRYYDNIARLIGLVAAGELQVVVDRTFPLAEAAAAHAHLESRGAFGRVVLVP